MGWGKHIAGAVVSAVVGGVAVEACNKGLFDGLTPEIMSSADKTITDDCISEFNSRVDAAVACPEDAPTGCNTNLEAMRQFSVQKCLADKIGVDGVDLIREGSN